MKNGTAPARLYARIRDEDISLLRRDVVRRLSRGISHPDRAIARLAKEGLVEKVDRGVWLRPTGKRPSFDVPRLWSNPSLEDPLTIAAIVVANPTLRDVTRILIAYGRTTVERALAAAKVDGAISPSVEATARRMIAAAWRGLADAAR